jgi:hypothetical protein
MTIDEAMYFAVAMSHSLPYVDVLDQKPPLIYAWYKLALLIGGGGEDSVVVLRFMAGGMLAATCLIVFELGRATANAKVGAAGAVICALLVANGLIVRDANTETFALVPFSLGILAYVRGTQRHDIRLFAAGGALMAVATATKTPFVVPALALCYLGYKQSPRFGVAFLVTLGVLLALVPVPWLLTGHFAEFWQANVTFNLRYSASVPFYERPLWWLRLFRPIGACLPIVILAVYGARKSREPGTDLWRILALSGVASVLFMGLSLDYYLAALYPAASLLAAHGWFLFTSRRISMPALAGMGLAVFLSACILVPMQTADNGKQSHELKLGIGRDEVAYHMADLVNATVSPDENVQVVGEAVHVYLLTGRQAPDRIVHTGFLDFDKSLVEPAVSDFETDMPDVVVELLEYRDSKRNKYIAPIIDANYELQDVYYKDGSTAYLWRKR